jgi:hypothetical protein
MPEVLPNQLTIVRAVTGFQSGRVIKNEMPAPREMSGVAADQDLYHHSL